MPMNIVLTRPQVHLHSLLDRSLHATDRRELPTLLRRWPLPPVHHRLARRRCLQYPRRRSARRFAYNDYSSRLLHRRGYSATGAVLLV